MTLEEIALIKFDYSNFLTILDRILDFSVLSENEAAYSIDEDESKTFYDRIILNQKLVKPSLERIEEEIVEYKAELTAIENARLAEVARVENIKSRFSAIKDIRGAIAKAGFDIPNPAVEMNRIISEDDQDRLALLESKGLEFDSEKAEKEAAAQADAQADGLVNLCLGCVKIVMKHNIKNGLTKEQKDQQAVDYSAVFDALKDWRPGKFFTAVNAMTPDGVLVTAELKIELVSFLSEHLS